MEWADDVEPAAAAVAVDDADEDRDMDGSIVADSAVSAALVGVVEAEVVNL